MAFHHPRLMVCYRARVAITGVYARHLWKDLRCISLVRVMARCHATRLNPHLAGEVVQALLTFSKSGTLQRSWSIGLRRRCSARTHMVTRGHVRML